MKKFAIGSAITAGVMFFLGILLMIIGITTGGTRIIADSVMQGVGIVMDHLDFNWNGISYDFMGDQLSVSYNSAYPVINAHEFKDLQVASGDEVNNVAIYMAKGDLDILNSRSGDVGMEWDGVGKLQYYIEDGTLYVISTEDLGDLKIYLPKESVYDSFQVSVAAGDVEIDSINAAATTLYFGASDAEIRQLVTDSLNIETGACELKILDGSVGDLKLSYSASSVEFTGDITGNAEIAGNAGELSLKLWGDADQFNYSVNSSMGNVDIPGYSVVGLSQSKMIDNGASKDMVITSSVGRVAVTCTAQ